MSAVGGKADVNCGRRKQPFLAKKRHRPFGSVAIQLYRSRLLTRIGRTPCFRRLRTNVHVFNRLIIPIKAA